MVVASDIGLPISRTSSKANSSALAMIKPERFCKALFRVPGDMRDQWVSKAARELATAWSTSRWPHSATSASDLAVTGLMSSEVFSVATRAPLITARPSKLSDAAAASHSFLVFISLPELASLTLISRL